MLEGQNGLDWRRWQRLGPAVEDLGFAGLFRSDHFTNAGPPDREALELWISLAWLAANTTRIAFGPLVTPASFRHPVHTARMARDVDDLAGGRLVLGVGAGWQAREHEIFGFDLLEVPARMARFEEALEVITRLLRSDAPASFDGRYFRLREATLLPRPSRPGGPPILVGGNGRERTLRLAARYGDAWNAMFLPPAGFSSLNGRLDELLDEVGRDRRAVRRSLMTGLVFGTDDAALTERLRGRAADELRDRGIVVGTPAAVVDQLGALAAAGVERVMLQWIELDDLAGLDHLARAVLG